MPPSTSPPSPSPPTPSVFLKGVLLGDYAVGKSSLFRQHTGLDHQYCPTVGVDFQAHEHHIDGHTVRLQLWDTAGQERFRSIVHTYVRNVYAVFLVFDVTRRTTFEHLSEWVAFVRAHNHDEHVCVVVANKVDKPRNQWRVLPAEVDAFAREHDVFQVHYVSAIGTTTTTTPRLLPVPTTAHRMFTQVLRELLARWADDDTNAFPTALRPDASSSMLFSDRRVTTHLRRENSTASQSYVDGLQTPPGSPRSATGAARLTDPSLTLTHFGRHSPVSRRAQLRQDCRSQLGSCC